MTDTDRLAGMALIVFAVVLFAGLVLLSAWDHHLDRQARTLYRTKVRRLPNVDAAGETVMFTAATELSAAATSMASRTITGLILPWEEYGDTSAGRLIAGRGSVRLPSDVSRVKLVDHHQDPPRPIGYGLTITDTPRGLEATFRIGQTAEGDRALLEASEHLTDAFSVELSDLMLSGDRITSSMLSATALLGVPAFANARVASVTAAQAPTAPPTEGTTTMTDADRARLAELLALSGRTPDEEAEFQRLQTMAVQEATGAGAAAPAAETPPPAQAAAAANPALVAELAQAMTAAMRQAMPAPGSGNLATMPPGLSAGATGQVRPLADLYGAMARSLRGESRPHLEAALADITQTANAFVTQDQYAGQLWQALDYTRTFVQLLAGGDGILKSYKGNGWKWNVAPAVAAYAGDKAAVPSNAATTSNVPWTASRLAGAHDIDRKFRDFGDEEFIQAYYAAMTLSYAMLSDFAARDFVVASATAGAAVTGGLLTGIAKVAARLTVATNGQPADYVLLNDQDKIGLLSVAASSVPAFLSDFLNIAPGNFIGTTAVPAGTLIVGNKKAGEFKELPGSPIRVELVNQVNAGIDGGVFGYYATILNMPTAIQKAAWT